jgi:hypothetical protein
MIHDCHYIYIDNHTFIKNEKPYITFKRRNNKHHTRMTTIQKVTRPDCHYIYIDNHTFIKNEKPQKKKQQASHEDDNHTKSYKANRYF